MTISEKYLALSTPTEVRSLEVRSSDWRFCMLRPDHSDRIEVVRAHALHVLVDHLISDGTYAALSGGREDAVENAAETRIEGSFVAADALQMVLITERPDSFMSLSETEVYAITEESESDPVRRHDIHSWKAALPLVVVRSPRTGHRVPDGNVKVIDATSDRTFLRSLSQHKVVLTFEDGRPFL